MTVITTILNIFALLIAAFCTWWAWNQVSDLFPFLPVQWQHLSFMQCFFLAWLLRVLTGVVRTPDIKVNMKDIVHEARKRR